MAGMRRYDLDWLRVIALGLLMVYHTAVVFQPWGLMIGFITSDESWTEIWIPMQVINVWRIPLLFFISGMGFYRSVQRHGWVQELKAKGLRILLPLLWGCAFIVPLQTLIWQGYYNFSYSYVFQPGHLWFLINLLLYIIVLLPVAYFLKRKGTETKQLLNNSKWYAVSLLIIIPLLGVGESVWLRPQPYEFYATTLHGLVLGFWAFGSGMAIMLAGTVFWEMISGGRWLFLAVTAVLCSYRLGWYTGVYPLYLLPLETFVWVITVLAFGYRYLNRSSGGLVYLRESILPFYSLHMLFLFVGSCVVLKLSIPVYLKYAMLLCFTAVCSWMMYEFLIRRIPFMSLMFGLKRPDKSDTTDSGNKRRRKSI